MAVRCIWSYYVALCKTTKLIFYTSVFEWISKQAITYWLYFPLWTTLYLLQFTVYIYFTAFVTIFFMN